jgi:cysteinyl-tRNA synthetase
MRVYNTLFRKVQDFTPLKKGHVGMYHCGPTVYNFAHIGNLRAYIFADTIRRAFEYLGYKTKQVINITDVGHLTGDLDNGRDKIEEGAAREKKTADEIIRFYTDAFFSDLKKLNIETSGTHFPRATEHIKEQINLIEKLEEKGFTYRTSDGIYFDTSKFKDYGKLGNIDLAQLEEGARVARNTEKRNPTDFALWKFSPSIENLEKRQQEWPSSWGVGFPGWHLECSAMAMKYLGETFDIHTGGIDHIPVHHNNEIAQSEAVTGKPYVRNWLHGAFVNIASKDNQENDEKMSKSKDNFIRLETLAENNIHPLAYRYWLLTAHYRSPILFSFEAVLASQTALESIVSKIASAQPQNFFDKIFGSKTFGLKEREIRSALRSYIQNDFDTSSCVALLHKAADGIAQGTVSVRIINDFDKILGLKLRDLAHHTTNIQENIKKLSRDRENLRKSNKWQEADEVRKEIEKMGYIIEDTGRGSRIRRPLSGLIGKI